MANNSQITHKLHIIIKFQNLSPIKLLAISGITAPNPVTKRGYTTPFHKNDIALNSGI